MLHYFDTNEDGTVDLAEVVNAMDGNDDGKLTMEECMNSIAHALVRQFYNYEESFLKRINLICRVCCSSTLKDEDDLLQARDANESTSSSSTNALA